MTPVRQSPSEFAVQLPAACPLPALPPCPSISQFPDELASNLNPWRWKVQTCGSFAISGSFSVAPSWILRVPLLP